MNGGSFDDTWAQAADAREAGLPKLGAYPVAGLLRRARRIAGLSQRELARRTGVSPSTVGRIESGAIVPVLPAFARMIAVAGLWLVMVDNDGHIVQPMRDIDDIRNGGGRLYPSHLDTILDPRPGEWWGDQYGLARPPETFHRDPKRREALRARSIYSVREIWSRGLGDMSAMPRELDDAVRSAESGQVDSSPATPGGEPTPPADGTAHRGPFPIGFRRRRKRP
jgi:transcriptional regulator with XRE-family HTH domain